MKLLFLIPVGYFWYKYFTGAEIESWKVVFFGFVTIVLFFVIRSDWRKVHAANNVVAAAATFQNLSEENRQLVQECAIAIIYRSGFPSSSEPNLKNDASKYGWYALALAELGIPPICLIKEWSVVRNPFIAVTVQDKRVQVGIDLAKKEGFTVHLEAA